MSERSEEALRAVFAAEPVTLLAPRPGALDGVLREGRRRRRQRQVVRGTALGVVAAAVAGVVAVSVTLLPQPSPVADSLDDLPDRGPVPAGTAVASVSTTPAGAVYALGDAPCGGDRCPSLVRSLDDGATWDGLPLPRSSPSDPPEVDPARVTDVVFRTAREGWLFGGGVWRTDDGGGSWTLVEPGGTVLAMAPAVAGGAWAVLADCSEDPCSAARLVRIDGADVTPVDLDLPDGDVGAITLETSHEAGVLAVKTSDDPGGVKPIEEDLTVAVLDEDRWTEGVVPAGAVGATGLAVSPAGALTWVVGRDDVVRSDDGASWSPATPLGDLGDGVPLLVAPGDDSLVGAAQVVGAPLQVSTDGGGAWVAAGVERPDRGWQLLHAEARGLVVAVPLGGRAPWVSTDAGRSWTERPLP